MSVIEQLRWEGDLDGLLHITRRSGDLAEDLSFDRPGDVVATCTGATFPSEELRAALSFYGVVLASRGVPEVTFVRPIVAKTVKFMATIDMSSVILMRELSRLKTVVETSDLEGTALRQLILEEARAMHDRTQQ